MRAIPILLTCLMASAAYGEGQSPSVPPAEQGTLTTREVNRALRPYRDEIRGCYLASAEGGTLDLRLTIHRDGSVDRIAIATRNLAPRAARQIDSCIRALSVRWQFPERPVFTTVTVPFRFTAALAAA